MICYYRLREVAAYVIPLSCYPHSELPASNLSEILAPSSLMVGRKFELNVDEWKFVGHPFSAQTVSFTTACNVVFVLQVSFNFTPSTFVLVVCKNRGEELAQLVA